MNQPYRGASNAQKPAGQKHGLVRNRPHRCPVPFNWFCLRFKAGSLFRCKACEKVWVYRPEYSGWAATGISCWIQAGGVE
jgi:hypothetical protein